MFCLGFVPRVLCFLSEVCFCGVRTPEDPVEAGRDVLVRDAASQRLSKAAQISVCGAEGLRHAVFMSAVTLRQPPSHHRSDPHTLSSHLSSHCSGWTLVSALERRAFSVGERTDGE